MTEQLQYVVFWELALFVQAAVIIWNFWAFDAWRTFATENFVQKER